MCTSADSNETAIWQEYNPPAYGDETPSIFTYSEEEISDEAMSLNIIEAGAELDASIGDNITVNVPAGTSDEKIAVFHGFIHDDLVTDEDYSPAYELMMIDAFQVRGESGKPLDKEIHVEYVCNTELLYTINESIKKAVADFEGFTNSDFGISYWDANEKKWIETNAKLKSDGNTLELDTQYPGIYFITIKKSSMQRAALLYNKAGGDQNTAGASKTVEYNGQPREKPGDPRSNFGKNCSTDAGGVAEVLGFMLGGNFSDACYNHDWCYRYGKGTYDYSRVFCDTRFGVQLHYGCFIGFGGPASCWRKCIPWIGCFTICIPNPLYYITGIYCHALAGIMHLAVVIGGEDAYRTDISGCYDYEHRGTKCEYAMVRKISFEGMSENILIKYTYPGNTIKAKAFTFYNNDDEDIDTIDESKKCDLEWSATVPDIVLDIQTADNRIAHFTIPETTLPGIYSITASLYKDGGFIHKKTVKFQVVSAASYNPMQGTSQYGTTYYESSVKSVTAESGTVTGFNTAWQGVYYTEKCTTEWCGNIFNLFRCEKCKNVAHYYDIPGYAILKRSDSGSIIWQQRYDDGKLVNFTSGDSYTYSLVLDTAAGVYRAVRYNDSGGIAASVNIDSLPAGSAPEGIAAGPDGLYICFTDGTTGGILRFDPVTLEQYEGITVTDGSPRGIKYHKTGLYIPVLIGDAFTVRKYTTDLDFRFATEGIDSVYSVPDICIDESGYLYAAVFAEGTIIAGGAAGKSPFILKYDLFGGRSSIAQLPGVIPLDMFPEDIYPLVSREIVLQNTGEGIYAAGHYVDGNNKTGIIISAFTSALDPLGTRYFHTANSDYCVSLFDTGSGYSIFGSTFGDTSAANKGASDLVFVDQQYIGGE